jgi:hypothetical protein
MWVVTANGLDDRGTIAADGYAFLDACANLRRATVGLTVRSLAWNNSLGFLWTDFHEIRSLNLFLVSLWKNVKFY